MTGLTADSVRHVIGRIADGLKARGGDGVDETLARLAEQDVSDAAFLAAKPASKPVDRYLAETLVAARVLDHRLADGLSVLAPHLQWLQSETYSDAILGEGFSQNYAWCELIGACGFFAGSDFNLGFLLLGPNRHYLDHYHPAPELYWPLTAPSEWKKGDSGFVARQQGEVIWHPSMVVHATITRDSPLLAAFAWTRHAQIGARLCALDAQA
jgi:hypothetical protein